MLSVNEMEATTVEMNQCVLVWITGAALCLYEFDDLFFLYTNAIHVPITMLILHIQPLNPLLCFCFILQSFST